MTVTQEWSVTCFVSSIIPGDRGGVPSKIKDISLEQFALLPSALVSSVSRKQNIFPALPSQVTRHRIVRLPLEMWARLFRPTFAQQCKSCRFNVLPHLSVQDHLKHATCVAKFIHFMCLDLLRILQQTIVRHQAEFAFRRVMNRYKRCLV